MPPRSARWAFTYNNPDHEPTYDEDEVAYLVYQLERGEQEETPHLQGYVRFHRQKTLGAAKACLNLAAAHFGIATHPEDVNRQYCTKDDTHPPGTCRVEHGVFDPDQGKQGRRTDLTAIAVKCQAGTRLTQIAQEHPGDFIRYHAGIERLHQLTAPPPAVARDVVVWVLWGATGTGKTHRVMMAHQNCYVVAGRGRDPWGQYNGQEVLLMDEFDWERWSIQEMNKITDKWRYLLDARYRDRYAEWTQVYICSNETPTSWWPNASQPLVDSIRRRLRAGVREVLSQVPTLDELKALPPNPAL